MPPHPLTNFEIQKCYENESRFNGVFSRGNLPKKININRKIMIHIGLLYFVTEMKLFILVVLVLNIFLKKLKNLLGIKI